MTYYGIYKITNLLNGKMYIGQHTTSNLDDGYMGSGLLITRSVKKHGKENSRKEWLMFCEDQEELNYMEMVFVNQDWIDRSDTYNLVIGGNAPPHGPEWSKAISEKLSGGISGFFGKHHSEETKRLIKEHHRRFIGKHHSEETKRKIVLASRRRKHSEETKRKIADKSRGRTPNLGKKWYNNGVISRLFNGEPPEGFIEGRIDWVCGKSSQGNIITQEDKNTWSEPYQSR